MNALLSVIALLGFLLVCGSAAVGAPNIVFILADGLSEEHNLASIETIQVRELHASLDAWRRAVGAQMASPHAAGIKPSRTNP